MGKERGTIRPICDSGALVNGGKGVRFMLRYAGQPVPAFAVRYHGIVQAYVNRCAHRGVELDWEQGHFFDADNRFLICATHGALYEPASGVCVGGPCRGAALVRVPVIEADGQVCLAKTDEIDLT